MSAIGGVRGNVIILQERDKLVRDDKNLANIFNEYYVNIIEHSTGTPPTSVANELNTHCDSETVTAILNKYKDHPSIIKIKDTFKDDKKAFTFQFQIRNKLINF